MVNFIDANGNVIRQDVFSYSAYSITEVRTLSTGSN